jgi:hypothetical protein
MKIRRREIMFRKHFRFRRMVLGLAFASIAVPVSSAAAAGGLSTFVDGGPAPVSNPTISTYQPSYLRYHEVGVPVATGPEIRSENARATSTLTGLQADGLRYTAMAQRYQELQPTVAVSERSNGVTGPDPSLVPQIVSSTSSSFDWRDAGLGASTAFGVALLLGIGIVFTRRNQDTGLTSA